MQRCRKKCERPSGMTEKESKHFMIPILHLTHIRIPDVFVTRFGVQLSTQAKLTLPDGHQWKMELNKCGDHFFFSNKWKQFAKYYSIGYGYRLSFKHEGDSNFRVIIFDASSVEISYPKKRSNAETSEHSARKRVKRMSKTVEDAAKAFTSEYPYFRSKCTKGNFAYVASGFAKRYLELNVPIKLRNSHGEEWEVFCVRHEAKAKSFAMQIGRGFVEFERGNDMSKGDYCVFELIEKKPVVLKVTMFHAADYRD